MANAGQGKVISGKVAAGLGKSLRQITASWMGRAGERPPDPPDANLEDAHTYSYTANSGEMNHTGQLLCDVCEGEMHAESGDGGAWHWRCGQCGRCDGTSFRVCPKCERKTVPDKWAARAPGVPVSLNAGGCTACERCMVCDGVLALGNLMWFHGRWTHTYPSPEFDRRANEELTVMRERSKFYGFHAHHSCYSRHPQAVAQCIKDRTPEWFKQGEAEQTRAQALRLRGQHRCQICKNPLTLWDRLLERDTHKGCV